MFSIVKLDSFLVIVNEENFSYIFPRTIVQYLTRFNDRLIGGGGDIKGQNNAKCNSRGVADRFAKRILELKTH